MLSKLKSLFGAGRKTGKTASTATADQSQTESVEAEPKSLTLQHSRELSLAFTSSLLGSRAVETDASRQQEEQLTDLLEAELLGLDENAIPKMSKSALDLMQLLMAGDVPSEKIVSAIKQDPGLAGKVIAVANSPLYIGPGVEIKDLEHALGMLGLITLKKVVMASLVADQFELDSYYFDTFGKGLWEHSSEVAINASTMAKAAHANDSLAYFVGLVHDIGKLIIFKQLVLLHKKEQQEPHPAVFGRLLDRYADALTRQACQVWGLPEYWYQPIQEFQLAEPGEILLAESQALYKANAFSELNALFKAGEITEFELVWRLGELGVEVDEFWGYYPQ